MLKRKIKYENFNGDEVENIFYFHFGIPELMDMEVSENGGITGFIERVVEEKDHKNLVALVKTFTLDAFGIKSTDGETFDKTPEIRHRFQTSAAYEALYTELSLDAEKLADFLNGTMPRKLIEQAQTKVEEMQALGVKAGAAAGLDKTDPVVVAAEQAPWTGIPVTDERGNVIPPPPVIADPPARQG